MNVPFSSVTTPPFVPLTFTVTPESGSEFSEEFTVPDTWIVLVCENSNPGEYNRVISSKRAYINFIAAMRL